MTSLLGALAAGPLARRRGAGRAVAVGLFFSAAGAFVVPLAHGRTWLSAALLVLSQVLTDPAATIYEINAVSLRQATAGEAVLARINGAFEVLGLGAMLLGAMAGGAFGERFGLRATLLAGAGVGFAASLFTRFSRAWEAKAPA